MREIVPGAAIRNLPPAGEHYGCSITQKAVSACALPGPLYPNNGDCEEVRQPILLQKSI